MIRFQYVIKGDLGDISAGDLVDKMHARNIGDYVAFNLYKGAVDMTVYIYGYDDNNPREQAQTAFDEMVGGGVRITGAYLNIYKEDGDILERQEVLAALA